MTFNLAECSIRVTVLLEYLDLALNNYMHIVGFHFVTHWLLFRFLYTTARAFYDNYSDYRSVHLVVV